MSSGAVNALVAWAASQGAGFEPVEVRTAANGNRGVFARRDIAAGEQVMLVPRELVITDLDVAATPLGADLRALAPLIRSPHSALAAWLALERRAPGTRWRPYLEALPTASWMPSLRSDAELASLAGTRAFDLIAEARISVALDHEVLADALVELTDVSLADFGWARAIVSSRGIRGGATGSRALVPIVDMIDHGGADVAVGEADGFECRALHAVRAGDEIRWHYGPHSNARWLAGYGFAVAGNPDDEATIRLGDGDETVVFPVGARIDARFTRALAHARRLCGDDTRALVALADAAEVGLELLARPVIAAGDDDWRRACEIVRAGERAVLERVVANARAAR